METEEKRTATDILLSIETRISTLEKRIQNSENLLKIMLGRLNQMSLPVSHQSVASQPSVPAAQPSKVINKDNFDIRPKTNNFSKMAAEKGVDVEDDEPESNHDMVYASQDDAMVEAASRGSTRGQRNANKGQKCSISQVIERGDSPVYIANIEVFNEDGQLINQTRTNTKGRWLMALAPGDYQVHVSKRYPPDSGKTPIDTTYQITVPLSDKPIELDSLDLDGS